MFFFSFFILSVEQYDVFWKMNRVFFPTLSTSAEKKSFLMLDRTHAK